MDNKKFLNCLNEFWLSIYLEDDENLVMLIEHIARVKAICLIYQKDDEILQIVSLCYQIGNIMKYNTLEEYTVNKDSNFSLGKMLFKMLKQKNDIPECVLCNMLEEIIIYFELGCNYNFCSDEAKKYINLIRIIDSMDKVCVEAPQYLLKHIEYNTIVTSDLLRLYIRGEVFDYKCCKTFADTVLYKATFLISLLSGEYKELTKRVMNIEIDGYANTLQIYKEIFDKVFEPKIARIIFKRLIQACK